MLTAASVPDFLAAEGIFDETDKAAYGDAAYPPLKLPEEVLNQICERATIGHPLTEAQKKSNHEKSKVRIRVEHVFAGIVQMAGGTEIRCKNMVRAIFNISMINLVYNMRECQTSKKHRCRFTG